MEHTEIAKQLRKPEGDNGLRVGLGMNQSNKRINSLAITMLELQPEDQLLELGMGNGLFVRQLLAEKAGIHYTGIDFSALMVAESTKNNEQTIAAGRCKFINSKVASMPLADQSIDKVFCVNLVYFWRNPELELAEIKRIMKPGARFVIGIRSRESMSILPFTAFGFTLYNKEELEILLQKNGFKIISVYTENELHENPENKQFTLENIVISCGKS